MILLIDDYDSFTWDLYQHFRELGVEVLVRRNDALTPEEIAVLAPEKTVISPGLCTPSEAGISLAVIRHYAGRAPLLGIYLGHQAIAQTFGVTIVRTAQVVHGGTSLIEHNDEGMSQGLDNPLMMTRYHSLVIDPPTLPPKSIVTAHSASTEIMGIRHRNWDFGGVQFHPESILSGQGHQLLENFLRRWLSVAIN